MESMEQLEVEIKELKVKYASIQGELRNVKKEISKRRRALATLKGWGKKEKKEDKNETM